jgi:arsenate reductase
MTQPQTVLFACIHNAGRSQMARAFFDQLADPKLARSLSAGTAPADRVNPVVVDALREVGLDVAGARPQRLTPELARGAALLITMGCGDECPYIPALELDDWPLPDPRGQGLDAVRAIRDEVQRRVAALVAQRGWSRTEPRS